MLVNVEMKLKSKGSYLIMDIGMLVNNSEFYDGFEDDHEIELLRIAGNIVYQTREGNGEWKTISEQYI